MIVKKFELFVNHNNTSGVVQVVQEDASGRPIDPIALIVDSEFVMAFASLFSEAQQSAITTLTAEKAEAKAERNEAVTANETTTALATKLASEKTKLTSDLATANANLATAQVESDAAKQEVIDIYELLGADPNIVALKKQQAIAQAEKEIADAIKRKDDLVNAALPIEGLAEAVDILDEISQITRGVTVPTT